MKKLLAFLACVILLLALGYSEATNIGGVQRGQGATVGDPLRTPTGGGAVSTAGAWYSSASAGTSSDGGANYMFCTATTPNAGTAKKLRVHYTGTTGNVKIALYDTSFNRLSTGCTVTGIAAGWNECTISDYTVTNQAYQVCFDSDAATTYTVNTDAGGTRYWYSMAYASFPPASQAMSSNANEKALVGIYVE
jgi:hypothetical protein